ncbi:unnamed protein product [Moneuplotes crassus]|uniref:Uncharacterized protein n=1 Tax=Euplotes crassus TaxID=5936 RepID=A0AAD2D5K1_EUPCR|nr:unnamed protein product [Moneuplotes crassus]
MSQDREDRSFDQREVSPFMFKTLNTGMQTDSGKDGRTSPFSPFFHDTKIVKSNKFHGLSGELTLSDDNLLSIKSGPPNSSYVMRMKNQISKSRRTRSRPRTMNSSIMKKKSSAPKDPRNVGIKLNINTMKTSKNSIKSPKSSAESKIPYVDPEKLLKQFRQKDIDDNNTKDRHNSSKYLESSMKNIEVNFE